MIRKAIEDYRCKMNDLDEQGKRRLIDDIRNMVDQGYTLTFTLPPMTITNIFDDNKELLIKLEKVTA